MPTGGGKSLCYQIPALARPGMGIVVSPLLALMADQVSALRQAGVKAAALNSDLAGDDRLALWRDIHAGARLLYVAPETLLRPDTLQRLSDVPLSLIAIDEAHCLSQWGMISDHPIGQLDVLMTQFPDTPRMALTATADEPTRAEILSHLQIDKRDAFIAGFDRPNIRYAIMEKDNPRAQLKRFLQDHGAKAASFTVFRNGRRKKQPDGSAVLATTPSPIMAAWKSPRARRTGHDSSTTRRSSWWRRLPLGWGSTSRMFASSPISICREASKPIIRRQGVQGRDGLPAEAMMLYGYDDIVLRSRFIEESDAPDQRKRMERQKLDTLLGLAETANCRRQVLLSYFGDRCEPCSNCDTCAEPPTLFDGTIAAQKILSCIHRTGERFGQAYIVDVLLGVDDERISRFGHDQISTFGIGREHDNHTACDHTAVGRAEVNRCRLCRTRQFVDLGDRQAVFARKAYAHVACPAEIEAIAWCCFAWKIGNIRPFGA